ncbi:hypothetical protein ACIQJ4_32330 [Streptomyces filamentosus]|uniref:hypothetical protein n=1 Tax=Streptomyces filamentosus TaxID=67294 RepID=UPI00382AD388
MDAEIERIRSSVPLLQQAFEEHLDNVWKYCHAPKTTPGKWDGAGMIEHHPMWSPIVPEVERVRAHLAELAKLPPLPARRAQGYRVAKSLCRRIENLVFSNYRDLPLPPSPEWMSSPKKAVYEYVIYLKNLTEFEGGKSKGFVTEEKVVGEEVDKITAAACEHVPEAGETVRASAEFVRVLLRTPPGTDPQAVTAARAGLQREMWLLHDRLRRRVFA